MSKRGRSEVVYPVVCKLAEKEKRVYPPMVISALFWEGGHAHAARDEAIVGMLCTRGRSGRRALRQCGSNSEAACDKGRDIGRMRSCF